MSQNGFKTQIGLLRKFAKSKDPRLHPNKQFLATLILGFLENHYPFDLIKWVYGESMAKPKLDEQLSPEQQILLEHEQQELLDKIYQQMGGKNGADFSSASS